MTSPIDHQWGPPESRRGLAAQPADPSTTQFVDREPISWVSSKMLLIVTAALGLALLITIVVALLIWVTPALEPLDIGSVAQG